MAEGWDQFIDRVKGEGDGKPPPRRRPPPLPAGRRPKRGAPRKGPPRKGSPRKGPPRKGPPRKGPPAPRVAAASRIKQEISEKAKIIPVEKLQQGGAKFVRVINPSTLSEIVGKAVLAVFEERGGVDEQERAEIELAAKKQFTDLLGQHQRLKDEKTKGDEERVKLEEARKKAEAERQAAEEQRQEVERERARVLAQADLKRVEMEQERLKALAEAREQREELVREREMSAKEREELQRDRAAALEGQTQAEADRGEIQSQMQALRDEIEASRQVLDEERERAGVEGQSQLVLSQESVTDVEYRVQALLGRMLRDGELAAGSDSEAHSGLESFKQELSDTVGRVLAAARTDASGGRSEAMDLLERRIAKLNRALVERQEAIERGEDADDLRFRADPVATIKAEEATARSSALWGAGVELPEIETGAESDPAADADSDAEIETAADPDAESDPAADGDSDAETETDAGSVAETETDADSSVGAGFTPARDEGDSETGSSGGLASHDPDHVPPWMQEEPTASGPPKPAYPEATFLSEPEPGLSRLVPLGSWPFMWRCGALRMVFLENLALQGIEANGDEVSGAFPDSSRLFAGGKVGGDNDPAKWQWPLHSG